MQKLAAEVIAGSHGLGSGHSGAIADALIRAGIDPERWTARAVLDALNRHMRTTGQTWPDRITSPAAFLAHRLAQIDWPATAEHQPVPVDQPAEHLAAQAAAHAEHHAARAVARAALAGPGRAAAAAALAAITSRRHTPQVQ